MPSSTAPKKTLFKRLTGLLPVIGIIALFCYGYYTYVFVLYQPLLSSPSEHSTAVTCLSVYHAIIALWTLCFCLAVFTHPGAIPEDWLSDCVPNASSSKGTDHHHHHHHHQQQQQQQHGVGEEQDSLLVGARPPTVEKKKLGGMRFCRKCSRFKPDRTHHCSNCGECILKMDHHCPWIGNCVGFRNYKYFLLFLIYTVVLIVFLISTIANRGVLGPLRNKPLSMFSSSELSVFVCFMITCVVGIAVFSLLSFHFYLLFGGYTTIELLEKKNKKGKKNPSEKYVNPYDLGYYANFKQVFGENPLLWLIPTRASVPGDGVFFPTSLGPFRGTSADYRNEDTDPLEV